MFYVVALTPVVATIKLSEYFLSHLEMLFHSSNKSEFSNTLCSVSYFSLVWFAVLSVLDHQNITKQFLLKVCWQAVLRGLTHLAPYCKGVPNLILICQKTKGFKKTPCASST